MYLLFLIRNQNGYKTASPSLWWWSIEKIFDAPDTKASDVCANSIKIAIERKITARKRFTDEFFEWKNVNNIDLHSRLKFNGIFIHSYFLRHHDSTNIGQFIRIFKYFYFIFCQTHSLFNRIPLVGLPVLFVNRKKKQFCCLKQNWKQKKTGEVDSFWKYARKFKKNAFHCDDTFSSGFSSLINLYFSFAI